MGYIGAPICVTILRILILSGVAMANPSILPFIELSWRSVLFWVVVAITVFVYIKASLADPGSLKTCPSQYLNALEAAVGIPVTRSNDLKVEDPPSACSNSDRGIGRIRVKRKQVKNKTSRRGAYNRLESEDGDEDDDRVSVKIGQRETFATRQRRYHEGKRTRLEKQLAIRSRVDGRQLSESSLLSSNHSRVSESIDQRMWDEKREDDENESWSDVSKQHVDDVIVDFAKDSNDESDLNVLMVSSGDESSYDGIESDDEEEQMKTTGLNREAHKTDNLNSSQPPTRNKRMSETELMPLGRQHDGLIDHSSIQNISTTSSASPRPIGQSTTSKSVTSNNNDTVHHQSDESEALYPCSTEESIGPTVWRHTIDDFSNQFNKQSNNDGKRSRQKRVSPPTLPQPCPHTFSFIKKSLGQVGVAVTSDTTASATVGATLTYAIAASAAAPFAVVGVAAGQIANTARGVLGVDNEVTKACQTLNRSARQLTTKLKTEETDEDFTSTTPPTPNQDHHDIESQVIGVLDEKQAIRARPVNNHISLPSEQSTDPSQSSSSLSIAQQSNSSHPLSQSIIPSSTSSSTSQLPPTISNLDPPVLRYRGTMTRTSDGHPCQSRIQLRFCRVCKKYQPLRTKHCSDCGVCVRTMDHHCPWLGSCVGENNRIWFFWFLVFQSVELTWGMIETGRAFIGAREALDQEMSIPTIIFLNIYLIISFMVMLFLVIMVFCLIGYHTFLAASNMTTWENIAWNQITYLKDLPEKKGSPFNTGLSSNLAIYCCPPNFWSFLRTPFLKYVKILYGPEDEAIWDHGEQQSLPCCGESSCCCCGCCSDC